MTLLELFSQLRAASIQLHLDGEKLKIKAPQGALTAELKQELKEKKQAIIEFLQEAQETAKPQAQIPKVSRTADMPLAYNQLVLWTMEQRNPGTIANNLPMAFKFTGGIQVNELEQALNLIIERHEVLRLTVGENELGEPTANYQPFSSFVLPQHSIHLDTHEDLDNRIQEVVHEFAFSGFDLNRGPLYRFHLIHINGLAETQQVFVACLHHLVSDGMSQNLLAREIATAYAALVQQQPPLLQPLSIQYADFVDWQNNRLQGDQLIEEVAFWRQQIEGVAHLLNLPTDRPRPPIQTTNGAKWHFQMPEYRGKNLIEFCRSAGITPFMGLMAAFQVVLSRHAQQDLFCLGMPTAGRFVQELEPLIGFFVNGVLVRADLTGNPSWQDHIERVKQTLSVTMAHQDTPVQLIADQLNIPRNPSYTPLAQVGFQLQDFSAAASGGVSEADLFNQFQKSTHIKMEPISLEVADAKFDMIVSLNKQDEAFSGYVEYNTDLYNESTIQSIIEHLGHAVDSMIKDPLRPVKQVPLISEHQLRSHFGLAADELLMPLTTIQQAFFKDIQLRPDTRQYATGFHYKINAPIDIALMEQAVEETFDDYSSVRVRFVACDLAGADEVYQIISPRATCDIEIIEFEPEISLDQRIQQHFENWCYIAQDPFTDNLVRVQIATDGQDRHWLLLACHHLIVDGISGMVALQRIIDRYHALIGQQDLPEITDPWVDFVKAERQRMDRSDSVRFWQQQAQTVAPLSFSTPNQWPKPARYQILRHDLDDTIFQQVSGYCRKHKTHPLFLYKLATVLLIKQYCRPEQDFLLWDIQSGRNAATAATVGVLYQQVANVIPLDTLQGTKTADDFFNQQRSYRRTIKDHLQMSLAKINEIFPAGNVSFQFNYFNFLQEVECVGQRAFPFVFSSHVDGTAQVFVKEYGSKVSVELWYDHRAFVDLRWLERFETIVAQIIECPDLRFDQLDYLLAEEKTALATWNHNPSPPADIKNVLVGFEQQCKRTPDAVAVVYDKVVLSYQQLDELSNQFSHALTAQGVGPSGRVGICLGRSHWMIVAVWGVIKSGASYVPIDSAYPKQRIEYLLSNSEASVLVTERCLANNLPEEHEAILWVDQFEQDKHQYPTTKPDYYPEPGDCFYTIYTSGSTGNPKGASVTHASVMNLQHWYIDACGFDANDRTLIISAFGFDLTQKNLFAPLLSGGTVVIPAMADFDSEIVVATIAREKITHLNCAPSAFYSLVEHCDEQRAAALASLRWVYLGGEPIRLSAVNTWLQYPATQAQIVNSYGPTECTDVVAFHQVNELESPTSIIPVGKPIYNTELAIVDENNCPLPLGLVGEIIVGGAGVGLGYLNNAKLTEQVFVDLKGTEGKYYKTGDLGRYWQDGNIEYIGRKDFQVKVRGQRIELGEIEAALRALPEVNDALVLVHNDSLIGYLTSDLDYCAEWQPQLRAALPAYMVPGLLLALPEWPLTPNGKIDRKALPDPDAQARNVEFVAPRNEMEQAMASIWSQILQRDEVGIDDNFFELGGHSLLANQIVARVRKLFQVQLPIRDLILYPTIRQQAERVSKNQKNAMLAKIEVASRDARIPLSASQQRLWLLDQIQPGNAAYHVPSIVKIRGSLNVEHLQSAFTALVNRHEGLRTYFLEDEQGPYQAFLKSNDWPLERIDASKLSQDELRKQATTLVVRPFSLNEGPLFRAACFVIEPGEYLLVLVLHHIITDGWSNALLLRELIQAYGQLQAQGNIHFPSLKLQYADYANWQQHYLTDQQVAVHLNYWKQQLSDLPVLELPLNYERPALQTFNGISKSFSLNNETSQALLKLAQQNECTPFMLLLAIYAVLLQRYSGQQDFAIGTPVAGRDHTELENIVGFFVNTLAIRVQPESRFTFSEFLESVKHRVLEDFEHQQIPFEQIVETMNPSRDMSRSPLFQVMFAYQQLGNGDEGAMQAQLGDIELLPFSVENTTSKFDQTLTLWPSTQGLMGNLTFNSDLFSVESAEQFIQHFINLCDLIALAPHDPLYQYDILTHEEKQRQLVEWNQTQKPYPSNLRIEQWVAKTAHQFAAESAVQWGNETLNYQTLMEQAGKIASSLQAKGVSKGEFVGLIMDRHLSLMPTIVGILMAGASYIPIDARYPRERIAYICQQSNVSVVLTRAAVDCALPQNMAVLNADEVIVATAVATDIQPVDFNQDDLIYVIYTSGSTGQPKGTAAYHRSEANLLQWYTQNFAMCSTDKVLLLSSIGFDLTQKNLFAPLVCGAQLVIPSFQEYDPYQIIDLIQHAGVTWVNCAPSAFYPLVDDPNQWHKLVSLRYVFLGGEPINLTRLRPWLEQTDCQLVNSYGPTECTDIAAWYPVNAQPMPSSSQIPIGKPNDNVNLYILGDHQELLPLGAIGELCISGAGVGPGYLNQAELTAEVFVNNPYDQTSRLYRTGDRARYLGNGDVLFLGRKDHQIKLRGYRVEVGEIQSTINQLEPVVDSLVGVLKSPSSVDQLVAWVVTSNADAKSNSGLVDELKQFCLQQLPSFMLPDAWVLLEAFPLTPNGKVDRKALPNPDWAQRVTRLVAPRNGTETLVQAIWQQVLHVTEIGIHDNFFALGGHSLLATQVIARIQQKLGIRVPIRDLMAEPTIAALAAKIEQLSSQEEGVPLIRVSREQRLPLSFAQQRLWLLDKIEGGSIAYHVPAVIRLKGALDSTRLAQALSRVFNHHEGLRTVFQQDEEGPYQSILDEQDWSLPIVDLASDSTNDKNGFSDDDVELELKRLVAIELMTPFDLAKGPLFRAKLYQIGATDYVFSLVIHHIVTDGWSMNLLVQDVVNSYAQLSQQSEAFLAKLPVQYVDFALWQRQRLDQAQRDKHMAYWRTQLADVEALELPLDYPRPPRLTHAGASISFELPANVMQGLQQLAQDNDTTLFTLLFANYAILLRFYSGQSDFCIGTPVAGREHSDLDRVVGFFVNTLAVRVQPAAELTLKQFIQQLKNNLMDGFSHQEMPFEQIVEVVDPQRDMSRSPIFQVMLGYQNLPEDQIKVPQEQAIQGLEVEAYDSGITASKYELNLSLWNSENGGLGGSLQYNTDLFSAATIENFIAHFSALAQCIVEAPETLIYQLDFLSQDEKDQQLIDWNNTDVPYPNQITVHQAVEQALLKRANSTAIVCGEEVLTAQQLNTTANQFAHYLIAQGVQVGDSVAVCMPRNLHLMSILLGILKAGAVYVPLDPTYPKERLGYIIDNAKIQIVVTDRALQDNLPLSANHHYWFELHGKLGGYSEQAPIIAVDPEQKLYLIFTSGSTGKPKGTAVSHRSEMNLLHWYCHEFAMSQNDRLLLLSAIGFDLTQKNLFAPLLAGATLVIPEFQEFDGQLISALIERQQITWLNCAPSAMYPLQDEPRHWPLLDSLRLVFLGGEPINLQRMADWLEQTDCQLINSYGPTECTDIAAWYPVQHEQDLAAAALPIGRPNYNVQLYVLGEKQELLPVGAIGELCISGAGVGLGYLNDPGQTEKVFITNPYQNNALLYRTGDRVRYRRNGLVEYLGRKDHQIKLRGYRIEVGEIQTIVRQHEDVVDCLVDVYTHENNSQSLVAWITGPRTDSIDPMALREHCLGFLPEFMVPDQWLSLLEFPLTPNGKVDRKALPVPSLASDKAYIAPRTPLEQQLAELWSQVLSIKPIGVHDNFFHLGGQSLLATQLVSRVSSELGRIITVRSLFEHPTLAEFAQSVEHSTGAQSRPPIEARDYALPAPLSYGQQRLWFFEQINPGTATNNMPVVLKLEGDFDPKLLQRVFNEIVRRQASLRTYFCEGEQGDPQQKIHPSLDFMLDVVDLSDLSEANQTDQLNELIRINNRSSFDLSEAPLMRAQWVILAHAPDPKAYLLFCMHHIISDGASLVVLFRELVTLYTAYAQRLPSPLPELTRQYSDFAQWQRDWLSDERLEKQLSYWQHQLAHAPQLLELPLDYLRPEVQRNEGATVNYPLDSALSQKIQELCQREGLTPFMFMLAAWKILLAKYSGKEDILVGVPSLGRHTPELEPLIGFFIQSLVMRSKLQDNPNVAEVLQSVKNTVLDAFQNSDVPIDLIVERLGVPRNASYTPLVQVAFQLLDDASLNGDNFWRGDGQFVLGNGNIEMVAAATESAKFDLTLNVVSQQSEFMLSLEYDRNLFKAETIQDLLLRYDNLCRQMIVGLDKPLKVMSLAKESDDLLRYLALDPNLFEQVIPLTAMQHDMFMDNLVNPTSLQSSHGWVFDINNDQFDTKVWQRAIQIVTEQQPMLRAKFVSSDRAFLDMGYVAIAKAEDVSIEFIDLTATLQDSAELAAQLIYRPYQLETDRLVNHYLIKRGEQQYTAVIAVHHAILDGAALNNYWLQLSDVYRSLTAKNNPDIRVERFEDFVHYDQANTDSKPVIEFWRNAFANVEPLDFTLPSPMPKPGRRIHLEHKLSADQWQEIKAYCRKQRVTPALFFKCLYGLVINLYCRADSDFIVQETFSGRIKGHYEGIGCYIQEVPFVFSQKSMKSSNDFAALLDYARQFQKSVKDYRAISIGQQLALSPRGRIGFMYNFYQFVSPAEFLGKTECPYSLASDPADNVQFVVTEQEGALTLSLYYHPHLFNDYGMLPRIASLSEQIIKSETVQLGQLDWVTDPSEKVTLLETWNDTAKDFDLSLTLHQRFEAQAQRTPDATAIVDDAESLTYLELNQQANQLAHWLQQAGIVPNDLVGLYAERSCQFLVGILGILKAGGAYVALDPKYPQDRIQYMIENSQTKVLVTQAHLLTRLENLRTPYRPICLDQDLDQLASQSKLNLGLSISSRNRAYMIYTSGSTGLPKGAIVRHDGALNHIEAERDVLRFPGPFNFLQTAPASSDISVWQFLGPVTCGGKVVVLDDVTNASKLFTQVNQHQVNVVELVPVALQLLMEFVRTLDEEARKLDELRWMMATGEAVSVDLVNDWLQLYPQIPVVNAYGPTEAADDVIQCAIHKPLPSDQRSVPIGKPLANLGVYILDDQQRLLPAGVPGEICIGGIGVGEGYWHNPIKTAQAFVSNPYLNSDTLYRTGDLGRWLADGSVEYLDRVDNQVKVRGFRIELGEVEAALSSVEGVRENVVVVRDDLPGGAALAAYVVAALEHDQTVSGTAIRATLRQKLPDFMVPASVTVMKSLPLTPAGKIDRKALPRPETVHTASGEYTAPRNEVEQQLADIWQSLMNIERISVRANFFELGGHSLIGVRIIAKVNKLFHTQLSVARLLSAQTIEKLAQLVEQDNAHDQQLVKLSGDQSAPLFMIHPIGGDVLCYMDLANALANQYNCYGIRAQGLDGKQAPAESLEALVNQYVDLILSQDGQGPYRLLGQSLGGIFVLAIARQLQQKGKVVDAIVLLDTYSPDYLRTKLPAQSAIFDALFSGALPSVDSDAGGEEALASLFKKGQQLRLIPQELEFEQFAGLYRVAQQNHRLASEAELTLPQVRVLHVSAQDNPSAVSAHESWVGHNTGFEFEVLPGGHETMMQGALAAPLAQRICAFIHI